ncbi:hypothetical protein [Mobilicoccus massiliensis]|uniref:hypothetical protein n=1 Tax=Mobilicoccus massiliensis TaxID=1522310 RepID=UPI001144D70B|nr:hypothetical protein [Mobilicoccus massiliensis]
MESSHPTGPDDNAGSDENVDLAGDTSPDERVAPGLRETVELIEQRDYAYEILAPAAVRVTIPSGDVVMGAVPLLDPASAAVAILAESRDGLSALVMRDGDDLFVVKRSPGAWEHFRSRGGPSAIFGSWRTGERTRFRMRHGALWKSIPEAVELAETLGIADLLPVETPNRPPRSARAASSSSPPAASAIAAESRTAARQRDRRGPPGSAIREAHVVGMVRRRR